MILLWNLCPNEIKITMEKPSIIVQVASKSMPFLVEFRAAWSVRPAYLGEIYPSQISDGIDG